MKTTKTFKLLSLNLLLIILLINIASAQTLVAGKVYTSGYDDIVSGATITVTCNSNALDTTSLDDGTYAVRFDESECGLTESVNVNGVKGDLSGSDSGVVIACNDRDNCAEGYVSIINPAIKAAQAAGNNNGGGGSNGRYYYCGNNKCDTGETATTCPKDCKINATTNANTTTSQGTVELTIAETQEQNTTENNNQAQNQGGLSRITGAVIGAEGNSGLLVIIVFLAILLASLIAVRIIRNRKAITEAI